MYKSVLKNTRKAYKYQFSNLQDLVSNIESVENARKEADVLKENIIALERDKVEIAEKLKTNEKSLEETLNKKAVRNTLTPHW